MGDDITHIDENSANSFRQIRFASRTMPHPGYDPNTFDSDLGVIKVYFGFECFVVVVVLTLIFLASIPIYRDSNLWTRSIIL